jgi:hypothetical protein
VSLLDYLILWIALSALVAPVIGIVLSGKPWPDGNIGPHHVHRPLP